MTKLGQEIIERLKKKQDATNWVFEAVEDDVLKPLLAGYFNSIITMPPANPRETIEYNNLKFTLRDTHLEKGDIQPPWEYLGNSVSALGPVENGFHTEVPVDHPKAQIFFYANRNFKGAQDNTVIRDQEQWLNFKESLLKPYTFKMGDLPTKDGIPQEDALPKELAIFEGEIVSRSFMETYASFKIFLKECLDPKYSEELLKIVQIIESTSDNNAKRLFHIIDKLKSDTEQQKTILDEIKKNSIEEDAQDFSKLLNILEGNNNDLYHATQLLQLITEFVISKNDHSVLIKKPEKLRAAIIAVITPFDSLIPIVESLKIQLTSKEIKDKPDTKPFTSRFLQLLTAADVAIFTSNINVEKEFFAESDKRPSLDRKLRPMS